MSRDLTPSGDKDAQETGTSALSVKPCSQHPVQTAKRTLLRLGSEPGFLLLITVPHSTGGSHTPGCDVGWSGLGPDGGR